MYLDAAAICDRGKVRAKNEDNLLVDYEILPKEHDHKALSVKGLSLSSLPLFGVFDGMGGYTAGEIASHLTANIARRFWVKKQLRLDAAGTLRRICTAANDAVCSAMRARSGMQMGSTAAMLSFDRSGFFACNIGDSPIFCLRDGRLLTVSQEHTERAVYEKVTGKKSEPTQKFRLTQNIGIFAEEFLISPYSCSGEVFPDDVFLLCSDGITDMLTPETIRTILDSGEPPKAIADTLFEAAMLAGGRDNITAVVIKIRETFRLFGTK